MNAMHVRNLNNVQNKINDCASSIIYIEIMLTLRISDIVFDIIMSNSPEEVFTGWLLKKSWYHWNASESILTIRSE